MDKFKVIPNDAVVDMKVSSAYMARVQNLVQYLVEQYGRDKFVEFAKKMIDQNGAPSTELEEHLITVSSFLTEFEMKAEELGLIKELSKEDLENGISEN